MIIKSLWVHLSTHRDPLSILKDGLSFDTVFLDETGVYKKNELMYFKIFDHEKNSNYIRVCLGKYISILPIIKTCKVLSNSMMILFVFYMF